MAKTDRVVMELLWNMVNRKTEGISRVEYTPQKPAFPAAEVEEGSLFRTSPESQGIRSEDMSALIRELTTTANTNIHHILVMRHGNIVTECHYRPYLKNMWHVTHSLCKSITGMAVGMLIDDGKLNLEDKIIDIFSAKKNIWSFARQRDIKVWHLLTMTSGVSFNEAGAVSGNNWKKEFLEAPLNFAPGTAFEYNSMNSYMLSAIVTELTGMSMFDYLKGTLFDALEIKNIFWERCPSGITKGGWGLYLCPEDAGKLGQLYLQKGRWKGRQLISESWVKESTGNQVEGISEGEKYGYQMWIGERPGSFVFNGMLGQNVCVYPDLDMVVVMFAGNTEFVQDGPMTDIIHRRFDRYEYPDQVLPENKAAYEKLLIEEKRFAGELEEPVQIVGGGWRKRKTSGRTNHPKKRRRTAYLPGMLNKRTYKMEKPYVGLFPLMMQVIHNNYTEGIREISFSFENGLFFVSLMEGEAVHKIEVGFRGAVHGSIDMHGETYLVAAEGKFLTDEDDCMVLRLTVTFVEEAAKREVKIHFSGDEIVAEWNETPGDEAIADGLGAIIDDSSQKSFVLRFLEGQGTTELIHMLIDSTIKPVTKGILKK